MVYVLALSVQVALQSMPHIWFTSNVYVNKGDVMKHQSFSRFVMSSVQSSIYSRIFICLVSLLASVVFASTYIASTYIMSAMIYSHQHGSSSSFQANYIIAMFVAVLGCIAGASLGKYILKKILERTSNAINLALIPLKEIDFEICNFLSNVTIECTNNNHKVLEFTQLQNTIKKSKNDLQNFIDITAEDRAKHISFAAHEKLIHDLHSPVSALSNMVSLSKDMSVDEETRLIATTRVPVIGEQVLNQLVSAKNNLKESIVFSEGNLVTCINKVLNQKSFQLDNKIKIIHNLNDIQNIVIPHDANLLQRAFSNLLENAIDAAKKMVRVNISIIKNDNAPSRNDMAIVSIKICDDGEGIPEELVSIYLQGRCYSTKAHRQAFGLSSTNHIIRSHGGKLIYRKSELGGSSFEIRLGII